MLGTREVILLALGLVATIYLIIRYRRSDSRRMKQKLYDTMSPTLRREIDEEHRQGASRQEKFEEAMRKSGGENL